MIHFADFVGDPHEMNSSFFALRLRPLVFVRAVVTDCLPEKSSIAKLVGCASVLNCDSVRMRT